MRPSRQRPVYRYTYLSPFHRCIYIYSKNTGRITIKLPPPPHHSPAVYGFRHDETPLRFIYCYFFFFTYSYPIHSSNRTVYFVHVERNVISAAKVDRKTEIFPTADATITEGKTHVCVNFEIFVSSLTFVADAIPSRTVVERSGNDSIVRKSVMIRRTRSVASHGRVIICPRHRFSRPVFNAELSLIVAVHSSPSTFGPTGRDDPRSSSYHCEQKSKTAVNFCSPPPVAGPRPLGADRFRQIFIRPVPRQRSIFAIEYRPDNIDRHTRTQPSV